MTTITTTEGKIAKALFDRVVALGASLNVPVAFPDIKFDKPKDANGFLPYLEVALLDLPTVPIAIAHNGLNEYSGLLQITVAMPQDTGLIKPREMAGSIASWFKRGSKFVYDDIRVQINRPTSVSPTFEDTSKEQTSSDPPYTRTPVTVRYSVFARQT